MTPYLGGKKIFTKPLPSKFLVVDSISFFFSSCLREANALVLSPLNSSFLSHINSDKSVTKLMIFVLLLAVHFMSTKTEFLCPEG